MLARAPGKIVISGAYAVLEGAPALVSAVDRFVTADSEARSELTTPEFSAAAPGVAQPSFDASALRADGHKLGLGSSAAILVACLGALQFAADRAAPPARVRRSVFERALAAHRLAQGGGSGVDVLASSFGGTLLARLTAEGALGWQELALPAELHLSVWAAGRPASTRQLVQAVSDLKRRAAHRHAELMQAQSLAAEQAADAALAGSAPKLLVALSRQHDALERLGAAAGVAIVVDAVGELHQRAQAEGACVLPAGAGGGDISIYAGLRPPSPELVALARRLGQNPLDLNVGATGLCRVHDESAAHDESA